MPFKTLPVHLDTYAPMSRRLPAHVEAAFLESLKASYMDSVEAEHTAQHGDNRTRQQRRRDEREARKASRR